MGCEKTVGGTQRQRHDRQRGVRRQRAGKDGIVADQQIGNVETAAVGIDHRGVAVCSHPARTDRMGGAVDGKDVTGPRRGPDLGERAPGVAVDRAFVGPIAEVDARLAVAEGVDLVSKRQAIIGMRQAFAVDPDPRHPIVAPQDALEPLAPHASAARQPGGEGDGQYAKTLNQIATCAVRIAGPHHVFADE